ncbi:p-hydroxybenzoate 3-monooxygenase [Kitasatospora sp. MAP12-15]|uniref:4-hydroxybenzoate 3-monooxygenase n=1 Tax=unclassified Kitasatospora TaxID=2633591 RepID=UPI002473CE45|nr:4-hydroxybenzoate 3-monooxygenase [Kitasatospora sp. MAP12-44]MDH6114903.1 p-hydroxybenzoate 3-monooxygenase [Kitasatospora sp. MAP12-44]
MRLRTQVGIIGAGPAGLVLANVLQQAGIECVVVERHTRAHVEARARAGVIEHRTADFLARHGLADQLLAQGGRHSSCEFRYRGERFSVPYAELSGGRAHHVYPQQFLVRDLIASFLGAGGTLLFSHPVVGVAGLDSGRAVLRCEPTAGGEGGEGGGADDGPGEPLDLDCEFVAGCDGFYGAARASVPTGRLQAYSKQHEFGWLAILAEVPPSTEEIIYALHEEGFAGHMLRTPSVSRFYLQCPIGDAVENWPEARIWATLRRRLAVDGWELKTGPITETSVLDMRSFVVEPMQYGRLFLVGDAAHIITPAGGKGMNLAIADAAELARGLVAHYSGAGSRLLDGYSAARLPEVWRAQEFSHWLLHLTHSPSGGGSDAPFMHRMQLSRLAHLRDSLSGAQLFAEGYVGSDLPGRVLR